MRRWLWEDADQTLRLALTESQADLRLTGPCCASAAMEFVIRNAAPTTGGKSSARSAGIPECPLREDDFDAKPADPCVFRRDLDIVWTTVSEDLPPLLPILQSALDQIDR